ncbi:hypothetical protein C8R45DRAFT_1101811 [Mycena sanguinolenta]|nr:hypothetical protein C8R45DRAFT_1101811 [Mycena sanguinolenta]
MAFFDLEYEQTQDVAESTSSLLCAPTPAEGGREETAEGYNVEEQRWHLICLPSSSSFLSVSSIFHPPPALPTSGKPRIDNWRLPAVNVRMWPFHCCHPPSLFSDHWQHVPSTGRYTVATTLMDPNNIWFDDQVLDPQIGVVLTAPSLLETNPAFSSSDFPNFTSDHQWADQLSATSSISPDTALFDTLLFNPGDDGLSIPSNTAFSEQLPFQDAIWMLTLAPQK